MVQWNINISFLAERLIWLHAICGTCFFSMGSNTKATVSFQMMIHIHLWLVERSDPIHSLSRLAYVLVLHLIYFSWMSRTFFDSCVDFHINYLVDALNWSHQWINRRGREERGQQENRLINTIWWKDST